MTTVLVTSAGGSIGHHLVKSLVAKGYKVRGVDINLPDCEASAVHEFMQVDLGLHDGCQAATAGMDEVYHLDADMGGIGFISGSHAGIALNNILIGVHMVEAAHDAKVSKFLFSSSVCVYLQHLQTSPDMTPLHEDVAWPAQPEEGYGLEKINMEKLCQCMTEDWGISTRPVRFHNVYGPLGTYDGGREKVPAAICRKVTPCPDGGEIEVWGDGRQTRSFANKTIGMRHDLKKSQGVRGRNSNNSRIREMLDWEPSIEIREGLVPTYAWIAREMAESGMVKPVAVAAE